MKKHGFVIIIIGLILIGISLTIAALVVPSGITGPGDLSTANMFEGLFDEVTNEIAIMPGDSAYVSYDAFLSETPLLWGVQIVEYSPNDSLLIDVSNIFGDNYGKFTMSEPVLFESLHVTQSDTLNFEITNTGSQIVTVVVMFSEDQENSDVSSNSDSSVMNMVLPLLASGFLLILGMIVSIIGVVIILVDLKNKFDDERNY